MKRVTTASWKGIGNALRCSFLLKASRLKAISGGGGRYVWGCVRVCVCYGCVCVCVCVCVSVCVERFVVFGFHSWVVLCTCTYFLYTVGPRCGEVIVTMNAALCQVFSLCQSKKKRYRELGQAGWPWCGWNLLYPTSLWRGFYCVYILLQVE